MALFKRDFNKPGPGVPKNAPRKRGFPRFIEILGRDIGNLVKLNFIYMLSLLPAQILLVLSWQGIIFKNIAVFGIFAILALGASVLVGPSTTAMFYIVSKMLRDDPGFVWHDYKAQFKSNFRPMAVPGIIFSLVVGSQIFAFVYYMSLKGATGMIMIALYLFSVLLLTMATPYFFTQAAYLDLKPAGLLKNSLLMALGYAPRSFMAALLGGGLLIAQVLFFPLSTIITIFIGYSIPCLLSLMWIWPNVDKTFKIESTLVKRHKESMGEFMEEVNNESDDQEEAEEDNENQDN